MAPKAIENLNFNKSQKYATNASIYLSQSTSKLIKFKPSFNLIKHEKQNRKRVFKNLCGSAFF